MKTQNLTTRHRRNSPRYCRGHFRGDFRRRGIFITDAVIGLAVLATLMAVTAITLGYDHRAQRAALDHRRLTTAAEQAMRSLQLGHTADDAARDATADAVAAGHTIELAFERLPDGDAPDGRVWVRVTATHAGQSIELVGVAPEEAAAGFAVAEPAGPVPPTGEGEGGTP